jgi:F-type H+-transporting ATPase subunit b
MFLFAAATAVLPEQSPQGIAALGVNISGLIFQVVNFALLLFLLYRFAFRPLLRVLEERRQTIEESLASAADIERTKAELRREGMALAAAARESAQEIIGRSEQEGTRIRQQAQAAGKKAAERLVAEAQAQVRQHLAAVRADLKQEMLGLVVAATERVLGEKLTKEKDQLLVEEALAAAEHAVKERRV